MYRKLTIRNNLKRYICLSVKIKEISGFPLIGEVKLLSKLWFQCNASAKFPNISPRN